MRWLTRLLPSLGLLLWGCSSNPSVDGAMQVTVRLEPGLRSVCARVEVSGAGDTQRTGPMALEGETKLVVGVLRNTLPAQVTVRAVGYSDLSCETPTTPAEASDAVPGVFGAGITKVELFLRARPSGVDGGDNDGGEADGGSPDSGSPDAGADGGVDGGFDAGVDLDLDGFSPPLDCDDNDFTVKPGAPEVCSDRKDNDCNLLTDCADPACASLACGTGALCVGTACLEQTCNDASDNDGDGQADCLDLDCAGRVCSPTGVCASGRCVSGNEVGLCADGVDNDNDSLIDCADPDCASGTCTDGNACTLSDVCGGGQCAPGAPKVCTTPPGQCFNASGACLPDAGGACDYAVRSGTCVDGFFCTTGDACLVDGGCQGAPTVCPPPSGQCFGPGACSEAMAGTCQYPVRTGTCDDSDTCTVGDACQADGGCVGARVTCTPPTACEQHIGCTTAGACVFGPRTGQACGAGGTCTGAAQCVTFPYTPSNFTVGDLPARSNAMVFNCGNTVINTSPAGGGISITNNCPGNTLPVSVDVLVGGRPAPLIFVQAWTVAAGNAVVVIGTRPLLVAVQGNVVINGTVDVSSRVDPARRGAGGSHAGCTGTGAGANGTEAGNPTTGGGGGGAGLGEDGANGANGRTGGQGGAKGVTFSGATLLPLQGGCRGGNGGGVLANAEGSGGHGGGAIQFSAGGTLTIGAAGIVTASGAGGRGALNPRRGGGAGGSGGAVLLEATTVTVTSGGRVTANGGGGGKGSSTVNGESGSDGSTNGSGSASGGNNLGCGGNGGNGGSLSAAAQAGFGPTTNGVCAGINGGGGGGGGAVGRIRFNATMGCALSGATVSPSATSNLGGGNGCP